ncbi:elongation factor P [Aquibaculum arenosum]|uniref:Elongation factor P n=1 Tax=Aquibaculum arenosum TaxID=3032591 RepID=A0ABT5YJQ5_9PROT|nr:elongation factor P [Fodinicurvata sp. CAU 1616]MDF2095175.1 elongation factor P [Fodinicurvata sp. CAU 1616]
MKVNASALRNGNVVEMDGKLYVILKADNIQPGKGTPVTQLEMRRISDGVKTSERFRTTEQVERAFIEENDFQFLYDEGEAFAFMQTETFEQVSVPKDVMGDQGVYLQEGMVVQISLHEGVPVSVSLPQRVILEVTETEPVIKNQTATSSYKPAMLSNGMRTGVPPHISVGQRIVVNTADGSYMERAKD